MNLPRYPGTTLKMNHPVVNRTSILWEFDTDTILWWLETLTSMWLDPAPEGGELQLRACHHFGVSLSSSAADAVFHTYSRFSQAVSRQVSVGWWERVITLACRSPRPLPTPSSTRTPVLAGGQQAGVGGVVRACHHFGMSLSSSAADAVFHTYSRFSQAVSRQVSVGWWESVSSLWRVALLVRCGRRLPHVQPVLAGGQQAGVSGVVRACHHFGVSLSSSAADAVFHTYSRFSQAVSRQVSVGWWERVITSACRSPRPLRTPSSTRTAGSRRRSAGRCQWGGERACHHFGVSLSSSAADAVFHTYSRFSQAVSRQVSVGWWECVITLACRSPRPLRTPSSTRTAGSRRRSAGRCRWGGERACALYRAPCAPDVSPPCSTTHTYTAELNTLTLLRHTFGCSFNNNNYLINSITAFLFSEMIWSILYEFKPLRSGECKCDWVQWQVQWM